MQKLFKRVRSYTEHAENKQKTQELLYYGVRTTYFKYSMMIKYVPAGNLELIFPEPTVITALPSCCCILSTVVYPSCICISTTSNSICDNPNVKYLS